MTAPQRPPGPPRLPARPGRPHRARHRRRRRHRPCLCAAARGGRGQGQSGRPGRGRSGGTRRRRRRGLAGTVEPHVLDLTDLDAAELAAAGTDVLVNNAGLQLVRPIEEFPPEVFHTVLTVMLEAPFRLIRGALPAHVRAGVGPHRERVVRARAARLGLQVGLCGRQTRSGGTVQDRRPRRRPARRHLELCQPRLCAHPPGRAAARRPGAGARHPRGTGAVRGAAPGQRASSG